MSNKAKPLTKEQFTKGILEAARIVKSAESKFSSEIKEWLGRDFDHRICMFQIFLSGSAATKVKMFPPQMDPMFYYGQVFEQIRQLSWDVDNPRREESCRELINEAFKKYRFIYKNEEVFGKAYGRLMKKWPYMKSAF